MKKNKKPAVKLTSDVKLSAEEVQAIKQIASDIDKLEKQYFTDRKKLLTSFCGIVGYENPSECADVMDEMEDIDGYEGGWRDSPPDSMIKYAQHQRFEWLKEDLGIEESKK